MMEEFTGLLMSWRKPYQRYIDLRICAISGDLGAAGSSCTGDGVVE